MVGGGSAAKRLLATHRGGTSGTPRCRPGWTGSVEGGGDEEGWPVVARDGPGRGRRLGSWLCLLGSPTDASAGADEPEGSRVDARRSQTASTGPSGGRRSEPAEH